MACLFPAFRAVPARLQRHRVVALWSTGLVVRSHPQSRGFAAQGVCRNSPCSRPHRGPTSPRRSEVGLGRVGVPRARFLWFRDAPFSPAPQRYARSRPHDGDGSHPGPAPEFLRRRLRYWRFQRIVGAALSLPGDFPPPLFPPLDPSPPPSPSPPRVPL